MCIGAFEGVVKKIVKRGRPRKYRPDDEVRLDKSSRTRSKNKATSSASSTTGYSDSNFGNSPRSELDDILDEKPFRGYEYTQSSSVVDNNSFQFSQTHSPNPDGYVSPQAIQAAHSPSAFSTRSHDQFSSTRGSIISTADNHHLPSHPTSPAKSIHSTYHSPPGLCESSSSPAASIYYDLDDPNSNSGNDLEHLSSLANISEHDDEMFLEAFSAASRNEMTTLERDSDLLMGKFDDSFGISAGDDLFRNEGDVFFGSP